MNNNSSYPKNQHYVPRFLLKRFAIDSSGNVHCFNKKTKQENKKNIKSAASESYFYDLVPGESRYSFEDIFGTIENSASLVIQKVLESRTVRYLSAAERESIATFIVAQYIRTKGMRQKIKSFDENLKSQFEQRGIDISRINNYKPFSSDEEVKQFSLYNLKSIEKLVPSVLNKKWFLVSSNNDFWISDNPVVLYNNMWKSEFRGNIGFEVSGIEIYLPLSPNMLIGFLDKRTFMQFEADYERTRVNLASHGLFDLQNFINSIKRKVPLESTNDNIEYYNSLQLMYSTSQVYSYKSNFELARSILSETNGVFERKFTET